jgi:hypothetical protein
LGFGSAGARGGDGEYRDAEAEGHCRSSRSSLKKGNAYHRWPKMYQETRLNARFRCDDRRRPLTAYLLSMTAAAALMNQVGSVDPLSHRDL